MVYTSIETSPNSCTCIVWHASTLYQMYTVPEVHPVPHSNTCNFCRSLYATRMDRGKAISLSVDTAKIARSRYLGT